MREADRRTIEEVGVPAGVLMEQAGLAVVAAIEAEFGAAGLARVAVVCGKGHNGGDGLVVGRLLVERGLTPVVCVTGRVQDLTGEPRAKADLLLAAGGRLLEVPDEAAWQACRDEVVGAALVVDGLVGTGLSRPLQGLAARVVEDLNAAGRPVVAIDVPSGLDADRADLIGPTLRASVTVAMAAPKLPLVAPPASAEAGRLIVAEIGIPDAVIDAIEGARLEYLTRADAANLLPGRRADANKGDFGRVLVVAGSRGRTGAAALSALAALRSGAGLVTVATPASCLPVVASLGAEYMTLPLGEADDGGIVEAAASAVLDFGADVIAMGPGLGRAASTVAFIRAVVRRAGVPLVLDADALNAFEGEPAGMRRDRERTTVITPHPGEMARLLGTTAADVQGRRLEAARRCAAEHGVFVVLKGHRTVVASPDGTAAINSTGNPGMATAGTGDVLTGVLAAWLGQTGDAWRASCLAVFLHGLAGDLARDDQGEVAMIARDLLARLGTAHQVIARRDERPGGRA